MSDTELYYEDLEECKLDYPIGSEVYLDPETLPSEPGYVNGLYFDLNMRKILDKKLEVKEISRVGGTSSVAIRLVDPESESEPLRVQGYWYWPHYTKAKEEESGWGTVLAGTAAALIGAAVFGKLTSKSEEKEVSSEVVEKTKDGKMV